MTITITAPGFTARPWTCECTTFDPANIPATCPTHKAQRKDYEPAPVQAGEHLVISGRDAVSIKSHVNYMRHSGYATSSWSEVQQMDECNHGCKLHVRRRGCVDEYALIHYAGYGCKLGQSADTRIVKVKVTA